VALYSSKTIGSYSSANTSFANSVLEFVDVNSDGATDIIAGLIDYNSPSQASSISVLINDGSGTMTTSSSALPSDLPSMYNPIFQAGDFTGDGVTDIVAFDAGEGTQIDGGFVGENAYLLIGSGLGTFTSRQVGSDAIHLKSSSAGDIDGDGDLDIYVESGGSNPSQTPYFLINDGAGNFTKDETRLDSAFILDTQAINSTESASYRYALSKIVDMNGDGAADLVLGQLRSENFVFEATTLNYDDLDSLVIFNDGVGNFTAADAVELPQVSMGAGRTRVSSIETPDLNGDGILDLVLVHEIKTQSDGRYIQVLQGTGSGFIDVTADRIPDQASTIDTSPEGSNNQSNRSVMFDVTGDGNLDIFISSPTLISSNAPLFYINDGAGRFSQSDYTSSLVSQGGPEGYSSFLADLNNDGAFDIVSAGGSSGTVSVTGYFGTTMLPAISTISITASTSTSADWVTGSSAGDVISGADGNDVISGALANDSLYGDAGNDTIFGNHELDLIVGGAGDDELWGGQNAGTATLDAYGNLRQQEGVEYLYGGEGNDLVVGNYGDDVCYGEGGNDSVYGGQNDDTVYGGAGNDDIYGNRDNDTLYGEAGSDTFHFGSAEGQGNDIIMDFSGAAGDLVDLPDATYTISTSTSGNALITYSTGSVEISGVAVSAFDTSWIV